MPGWQRSTAWSRPTPTSHAPQETCRQGPPRSALASPLLADPASTDDRHRHWMQPRPHLGAALGLGPLGKTNHGRQALRRDESMPDLMRLPRPAQNSSKPETQRGRQKWNGGAAATPNSPSRHLHVHGAQPMWPPKGPATGPKLTQPCNLEPSHTPHMHDGNPTRGRSMHARNLPIARSDDAAEPILRPLRLLAQEHMCTSGYSQTSPPLHQISRGRLLTRQHGCCALYVVSPGLPPCSQARHGDGRPSPRTCRQR